MRFIHSFPSSIQFDPRSPGPSVPEFDLSVKPAAPSLPKFRHYRNSDFTEILAYLSFRVRRPIRRGRLAIAVLVCDPGADLWQPRDRDDPFAVADLEHDDAGFAAAGD